ncbi:MAG: GNAT family N-acetyltransferase [Planctomycetota bacterium]|jgi:putative acetyltransferase
MEPVFQLRDVRPGEEERVAFIVKSVLEEYGLSFEPGDKDGDLQDITRDYLDRGGVFKVIEKETGIVGCYGLYPRDKETVELRKMYLLPEYRGRGIGKWMLEDALQEARERDFREVVLESNSVLREAIALYARYGFESFRPAKITGRADWAMKLRL